MLKKLKKIRKDMGYSQTDMARKVGVSINTYIRWELQVTNPNEENMKKLKKVLKLK